jgi:hypothetical protein
MGLIVPDYGPALTGLVLQAAPFIAVAAASVAAAVGGRSRHPSERRLLLAVAAGQAVGLAGAARQPVGGLRYLLPTAGLLGLCLVVLARMFVPGDGRPRRTPLIAGAIVLSVVGWREARSLVALLDYLRAAAREQEGAARAAERAAPCPVVQYHRASSVPSALLFGYGRPEVDGGDLSLLGELYPSAVFLDYVHAGEEMQPSSFRFLPYESWTHPRFRDFRGGRRLDEILRGRPCLAFQGSRAGPGRLFVFSDFARASIPVPGPVQTLYASGTEAVYRVDLDLAALPLDTPGIAH